MFRTIELLLGGLVVIVLGLSALSRRCPHVIWLRPFRFEPRPLSEEQRARIRQRSNIHAGIQLILLGLVLPLVYVAFTVMFFNEFTTMGKTLVLAGSLLLVALGVTAIWRNRRP